MDRTQIQRRLAASPAAPLVALGPRMKMVGGHNARTLAASLKWLIHSREHTNLTYDLRPLNREHLAWFVANLVDLPVGRIREYLDELERDRDLRSHILMRTKASIRKGIADEDARYGRRMGWYALVRAVKPSHIVETGTDKGLGSCVLAAALLRNGRGRLTTIDINPASGYLISPPYGQVIHRQIGDSLEILSRLETPVDLFLHDSDHSPEYEAAEFEAIRPHLTEEAWVLSDNAHVTGQLPSWAERNNRRFSFFDERPADHWYSGDGIGVAMPNTGFRSS